MDVSGAATANGSQIDQWPYLTQTNQQWTVTSLGNGQYTIVGVQSGRSLTVDAASNANGAKVEILDYYNSPGQHFGIITNRRRILPHRTSQQ